MEKSTLAQWFLVSLLAAIILACISLGIRVTAAAEYQGGTSRCAHTLARQPGVVPLPLPPVTSSRHAEA